MPRVLSESDVAEFRERLCEVAERLFAERGPEAVTMRQLASELGVSPMTPYRYFQDKDDILAAVRTNGLDRLSEALETARASVSGGRARGAAVAQAYIDFAFAHPNTYKLMFDLNQPHEENYPELVRASRRSRETLSAWVRDVMAEEALPGDPEHVGLMFWAAAHGAIVLELAGKLPHGTARGLHHEMASSLLRGLLPNR